LRLRDKVAIVTGAGTGIGRAIATVLAREGARVALVGRRNRPLEAVTREIGNAAISIPVDVGRSKDVQRIVDVTLKKFGKLNVLVNNAGVLIAGTAESLTERDWNQTFDTNVKAVWMLSRVALQPMREAGGGSIINLSSTIGLIGAHQRVAYSASKGAVTLLTKSMALDHGAEGIRINCICPGIVETELVADFIRKAPDPRAARAARIALHAIPRFGTPEDIAECAVYLASDESKWVTGAAIPVDGGYLAGKA
jgi:NAD(P)-dependent dehydrogenase (short-subunit alcohol dehydrogenase family)